MGLSQYVWTEKRLDVYLKQLEKDDGRTYDSDFYWQKHWELEKFITRRCMLRFPKREYAYRGYNPTTQEFYGKERNMMWDDYELNMEDAEEFIKLINSGKFYKDDDDVYKEQDMKFCEFLLEELKAGRKVIYYNHY